jgi:2-polyprenyl-3-methyl-5-hydroxy-6-metoxy-1,4-benzoquinol methylase
LAKLGWQVTATDFTDAYLSQARQRAQLQGLAIRFQSCDVRRLSELFHGEFDRDRILPLVNFIHHSYSTSLLLRSLC